ncbi:MAG: sulfatase-like hydrolase/transferase [Bdellovibrionota bacterium]
MIRAVLSILLLILLNSQVFAEESRPNVLIIVSDDQRYGTVEDYMPFTQKEIFDKGAKFTKGYVTTPSCCPSRASILTGMYASRHGVKANKFPLEKDNLLHQMQRAGYRTGLIGKYLNSWPGTPRAEADYWVAFKGGSSKYIDPKLNVNGEWINHDGHITYILGDYAREFIRESVADKDPFFLYFTPNAPHRPIDSPPEHKSLFKDVAKYRPDSWNPSKFKLKQEGFPKWIQRIKRLKPGRIKNVDNFRVLQNQAVYTLDTAIEKMINLLDDLGQLENTIIFYISDNGYLYGEHGLVGKDCAYQEAIHVPYAVRYDKLVKPGSTYSQLVANIDIAPTIYDLTVAQPVETMDGRPLTPIFEGSPYWRNELLIEGWRNNQRARRPYKGVHDGDFVYIETRGGAPELYNTNSDPFQVRNLADDTNYQQRALSMKSSMNRIRANARR